MPVYNDLRPDGDFQKRDYELVFPNMTDPEKKRTIENLLVLRAGLDKEIVPRKAEQNLLVASWNIKEFGHTTQRLPEAFFYLAEIVGRFDLVAIQEVKSNLADLYILMRLLGDDWSYLINDITEGRAGNSERSAYVYNQKRVEFTGLAGEIVLWEKLTRDSALKQLKRTPYMTGFSSGWKSFAMVNVHLHPGRDDDDLALRRSEVELLLAAIEHKVSDKRLWNENLILTGDFNFYDGAGKDDPTVQLIHDAGFREVESLIGVDTNASKTEAYDRFFLADNQYFTVARDAGDDEVGGVFNCFDHVYKLGQETVYEEEMKAVYGGSKNLDLLENLETYFEDYWRKNQLTDHFPVWFELDTDSASDFLSNKLASYE